MRVAWIAPLLVGLLLTGCGVNFPVHPMGSLSAPTSSASSLPPAPVLSPGNTATLLTEPQVGISPWLHAIAHATRLIEVNDYLLTDRTLIQALRQAAARGVRVRVLIDGHPYHDAGAIATTESAFSGSLVHLKMAPARFEGSYAFDHAKYLVADPGTARAVALVGSPNGTVSAFGGYNLEDAILSTSPAVTGSLAAVFHADWIGQTAGSAPRRVLVLSPGSQNALVAVLRTSGPIAVMAEEFGNAPALYQALAQHGSQARVLVPAALSGSEASRAAALVQAGVQVHTLATPYVHAKLIVTATQTFVGSQNFSTVSLQDNREVGIVLQSPSTHQQALTWFNAAWVRSTSWKPGATPVRKTWPYLGLHDSFTAVRSVWGPPTTIRHSTYHGTPQVVWMYPVGQVDFQHGRVVAVQRNG